MSLFLLIKFYHVLGVFVLLLKEGLLLRGHVADIATINIDIACAIITIDFFIWVLILGSQGLGLFESYEACCDWGKVLAHALIYHLHHVS